MFLFLRSLEDDYNEWKGRFWRAARAHFKLAASGEEEDDSFKSTVGINWFRSAEGGGDSKGALRRLRVHCPVLIISRACSSRGPRAHRWSARLRQILRFQVQGRAGHRDRQPRTAFGVNPALGSLRGVAH